MRNSPPVIMNFIKDRVKAINLDLNDWDYDRCHRLVPKYNKNGKSYQRVILNVFVEMKFMLIEKVCHLLFLMDSRQKTFEFTKLQKDNSAAQRVIQFVFVDENCKLNLKTK